MASKWAESESDSEEEYEPQSPVPSVSISVSADDYSALGNTAPNSFSSSRGVSPLPTSGSSSNFSPRPIPSNATIGFLSGVKFSARRDDIEKFLTEQNVQFEKLEPQMDTSGETPRFLGKVIVYCIDHANLLAFIALDGQSLMGMSVTTKVYEVRGGMGKQRGGRGSSDARNGSRDGPSSGSGGRRERDSNRGGGRGGDRDRERERPPRSARGGPSGSGKGGELSPGVAASGEDVKERPRLQIQPRTLPVETIGLPINQSPKVDIFGGAKPRDEFEYEKKKQQDKDQEKPLQEGESAANTDESLAAATETGLSIDTAATAAAAPTGEGEKEPATGDSRRSKGPNSGNQKKKERGPGSSGKPKGGKGEKSTEVVEKEGEGEKEPGSAGKKGQHVFTGAERKAKEHGKKGDKEKGNKDNKVGNKKDNKEKKEPKEPLTVEPEVDNDFTLIKSNKPKNSPKPVSSQPLPSPSAAAPKSSSKPISKSNSYAGLLSDSDEE